ncbi:MAG: 30S ribosomal protein S3 [Candidatus Schekmanbacteria bacterium]|nr:30S ribosomal protein S3 [Candidatus Schekmanbacteria bacterium]
MGQKVNPIGLRLGIVKTWDSRWCFKRGYREQLHEDIEIRKYVLESLKHTGVSKVEIERASKRVKVNIFTARPGVVIGKKGQEVEKLKKELQKLTKKQIFVNIYEVRKAEIDAKLLAENIATQLERRIPFRRAMKKAVTTAIRFGAGGVKIACSGRLGGAEMARREWYMEGRMPLHTLRANIDYGLAEANTTYGIIGVKVWVFKGEVLGKDNQKALAEDRGKLVVA